jgi:hypothetical protein
MSKLGLNKDKKSTDKSSKSILIGRVSKVIMSQTTKDGKIDKDFALYGGWGAIGSIKFDLFQDANNPQGPTLSNVFAKPLFSNIKQYPLVGEIVAIVQGPSPDLNDSSAAKEYFYIGAYNLWNSQHHNAFPDMVVYENTIKDNNGGDEEVSKGAKKTKADQGIKMPLGDYFNEKSKVNPLLPFEGDFILEGRNGQSIRFGSTVSEQSNYSTWSSTGTTGDPITIITNKRHEDVNRPEGWLPTVEDINKDGASIWLSSGQAIAIDVNEYPLDTFRQGFRATYSPDTVLPLIDLKPAIQNLAKNYYDKQSLDNIT